jgi:hypothetical protein
MVAQHFVGQDLEYVFETRYLSSTIRVWLIPKVRVDAGRKPLAETGLPTDKCVTPRGEEVVTYPPVPDKLAEHYASQLFAGQLLMVRSPNPEMPEVSAAFAAINDNEVQELPSSLSRMHASRGKQDAFNQTVLEKDSETISINSEFPQFLNGLSMEKPVFVYVNVAERMRRTQPICGQLWTQEDCKMSTTSTSLPDLENAREAVALSGIADGLSWRHVLETSGNPDYKRPGQSEGEVECRSIGLKELEKQNHCCTICDERVTKVDESEKKDHQDIPDKKAEVAVGGPYVSRW